MADATANTKQVSGLGAGLAAPFRGLALVVRPGALRRNLAQSLIVTTLVMVVSYGGAAWAAFAGIDALFGAWFAADCAIAAFFAVVLKVVAVLLLGLVAPVLFVVVAGVVDAPHLTRTFLLARATTGAPPYPARGALAEGALTLRSLGWALRRFGRFGLATLAVALFALVPVVGGLAVALQVLVSAWSVGGELLVPHFEGLGVGHGAQRRELARMRGTVLGLGLSATLLLLVPGLAPLFWHASAAGAGLLSAAFVRSP